MRKEVIIGLIIILSIIFLVAGVFGTNLHYIKLDCNKARELINEDYSNKIKEYESYHQGLIQSRNHILDIIQELEREKFDATTLKQKFNSFDSKVNKFERDYSFFLNLLKNIGDNTCDKTMFGNAVNDYLSQQKILDQDILDIKASAPEVAAEFDRMQQIVNSRI